jgi:transposase
MLGIKERAFTPVMAISLDALVPANHFYRHLERTLDLSFVREWVHDSYAATGRPSLDPVIFFKLQLVMFFEDIRSERLLMRHAADRLSVRWYLGYNLDEPLPDHSSLTRIRTRYGLEVFRRFFEAIVEQCQQAGLVWGRELYVDATKVLANASVESVKTRFAVEAHLASLFGTAASEAPPDPLGQDEAAPPAPNALPVTLPEPLREELAAANASRHDWIAQEGRPDRSIVRSGYHRVADYKVSTTDPDATLAPVKGAGTHPSYHTHYVVDGGKRRIILQVLVTPAEVMENQPALDLLFRTRFRWKLWPSLATGDTTYGTAENIVALEREHIRAYMPLSPYDQRTPFFTLSAFRYDPERDVYICPNQAILRLAKTRVEDGHARRYHATAGTCNACPLKAQCTPGNTGRSVVRHDAEEAFDRVRGYHQTEAYQKAMRKRSVWVEPLFAEAKDWHGMRRFRLRYLWRVNCEALLIASGQNLKRLLQKRGWGRRPLPSGAAIHLVFICWLLQVHPKQSNNYSRPCPLAC